MSDRSRVPAPSAGTPFRPRAPLAASLIAAALIGPCLAAGGLTARAAAPDVATAGAATAGAAAVEVTIADNGCTPAALSVPSGGTTFRIHNKSARVVEWEILDGVMVLAERENIIPGMTQTLKATLKPGRYQITCGRLSAPKASLLVAATDTAAPAARDDSLDGPIAAYHDYVLRQAADLVVHVKDFTDLVAAGKLAEARAAYAPAHVFYERIEPIAELFHDLDTSMDARANDFDKGAEDPNFTGFHRLEKALFADHTTEGMSAVAAKLLADAQTLQTRLRTLVIPAKDMVGGAADLIEEVAATKISGEEDRYSGSDLSDFQANIDGAAAIWALLRQRIATLDAALGQRIDANFARVDTMLAAYRTPDGFAPYASVTPTDRTALKGPVTALAEDLSRLRGTLRVE